MYTTHSILYTVCHWRCKSRSTTGEDLMATRLFVALLLLLSPAIAQAQSEAVLRDYFEGRTVKVKIAMPGTEDGVDIYPGTAKPLDYPRHASRLKNNGTALQRGRRRPRHQGEGEVEPHRVPARRRRLRHHGRRDLLERRASATPRRPSASRISRASSSASRIPPGGARSRRSSTTSRPSASARTRGTAHRLPTRRKPRRPTSGNAAWKVARASTSATRTAFPRRRSRRMP